MSISFTSKTLDETIQSSPLPVLVDVWTPHCSTCAQVSPLIDALAETYADRAVIGKANVMEEWELAVKYNVLGSPTLLLFKDGALVDRKTGAISEAQLREFLEAQLVS